MRTSRFLAQALTLIGFVLVVVAVEEHHLTVAFKGEDMRGDSIQEPAVMRRHQRATREFKKGFFQRAQRFHVQVVRGFVKKQDVAPLQERRRQMQTTAFTAREHPDQLLLIAALKVKAPEVRARGHRELPDLQDVLTARNRVKHRLVVGETVAQLRHRRQLHGIAQNDRTGIRLFLPVNHLKERRLAGTVGADDTHDGAGRHGKGQIVDEESISEAL